ncbi:MAG: efflux RND transporter periplasmic adaptor subunit [Planctomycetota bacterium]|nr:efflux RND transporter periplasmic adaptor subunit [Planctomycetota bacterium]
MGKLMSVLILILLGAGAGGWYWHSRSKPAVEYQISRIERGDLVVTISATGTLEAEEMVDVGAQVAGLIQSFGKDATGNQIDYRSPVEADMVLAKIDDVVYRADVDTAQAQLAQARATVQRGEADLATANAKLFQTEQTWNRAKAMGPSEALSQNDYDTYRADYETAKANVSVADAEIAQAKTGISQAQASLEKAQRNLDFCTIKSPVKGVIIDRRVNVGQTVVSSLNAPSLFLIAKDLTRMQIWVAVNEADIGRIVPGAPVTFTCDAFPNKEFNGTVGKVRLNATMTQNVVMYTVEVNTENPDSLLLPYLTANVHFIVQRDPDVLLVPSSALRWYPTSMAQVAPDARSWRLADPDQSAKSGGAKSSGKDRAPRERRGAIWVKDGTYVRPVDVKIGASDGLRTAVASDNLAEGQEVVTGEAVHTSQDNNLNPFLPPVRRR